MRRLNLVHLVSVLAVVVAPVLAQGAASGTSTGTKVSAPAKSSAKATAKSPKSASKKATTAQKAPSSTTAAKAPAGTAGPRRLEDIHIEGEVPVPQVLFITARDQRRFMEFQHHRYTRTSLELGRGTADFPELLGQLSAFDYHGWVTIERHDAADPVADIENAVAYLRAL